MIMEIIKNFGPPRPDPCYDGDQLDILRDPQRRQYKPMDNYSTLQALCLTNSTIRDLTLPVLYKDLIILDHGTDNPNSPAIPGTRRVLDNIISKGYYRYIRTIYYSWITRSQQYYIPNYIENIMDFQQVNPSQDLLDHFLHFLELLPDHGKDTLDILAIHRTASMPVVGLETMAKVAPHLPSSARLHIHKVYCTFPQLFPLFRDFITTPHLWLYETVMGEANADFQEDDNSESEEHAPPSHWHSVLLPARYRFPAYTSLKTFGMSYIGNKMKRLAANALYDLIQDFGGPTLPLETGEKKYCKDLEIFAVYDRMEVAPADILQFRAKSGPKLQVQSLFLCIQIYH